MKHCLPGTALLLVLIITSLLLTGTYTLWRASALAWEGALESEQVQRRFYLVEGLALTGIARIKGHQLDLATLPEGRVVPIYQGPWPDCTSKNAWQGQLLARWAPKTQILRLQARIFESQSLAPVSQWTIVCQLQGLDVIILECGQLSI